MAVLTDYDGTTPPASGLRVMISALIVILILMGGAAGAGVLIIAFMDPELNPRDGTDRFPKR